MMQKQLKQTSAANETTGQAAELSRIWMKDESEKQQKTIKVKETRRGHRYNEQLYYSRKRAHCLQ